MLEFSPDDEMRKIAGLANEFRKNILDNETFFVSDEANIFDVSGADPEELIRRIFNFYGKSTSIADLKQPFVEINSPA